MKQDSLIRTTISLPAPLYKQAKLLAAANNKSFSQLIVYLLKMGLTIKPQPKQKQRNLVAVFGPFKLGSKKIYQHRSELYQR